jgi:SAM-dependent methyltransferase
MSDAERSARQYDAMATEYAIDGAENAFNAFYERPATIALLGDVGSQRVLEAGCGSGHLTDWLVSHDAIVTAFDVSPSMASLARQRLGERAGVLVADIGQPLSFAETGVFDLVVASLVMHYVHDWVPVLSEFRRVLRPDGRVVFSTHHPAMDWQQHTPEDYFATTQVTETWSKGSGRFEVTFWRRPLTSMCESIASAGFVIERLVEPEPVAELADRDPADYELLRTKPGFLFFRLRMSLPPAGNPARPARPGTFLRKRRRRL